LSKSGTNAHKIHNEKFFRYFLAVYTASDVVVDFQFVPVIQTVVKYLDISHRKSK
jgi:hypothetical protein